MSLDNAAMNTEDSIKSVGFDETVPDAISLMSDRELAEYNARILTDIVEKINAIVTQVEPAMDKMRKNPMLGMLFR